MAYLVVIGHEFQRGNGLGKLIAGLEEFASVRIKSQSVIKPDAVWLLRCEDPHEVLDRRTTQRLAAAAEVDVYASSSLPMKRKLLLADMEATIILDEMLDVLAEERGIGEAMKDITARTMAGELDFAQSLKKRTRMFAGTPESLLKDLSQHIWLAPGARTLIQTLRSFGALTVLATGGYGVFAESVARRCGFDKVVANYPVIRDGVMTGELHQPIGTALTKQETLMKYCAELAITPRMACCIGDGANDLLMLQACGLPASYRGKPVLLDDVDMDIKQGDLTALLYAQGFTPTEIMAC